MRSRSILCLSLLLPLLWLVSPGLSLRAQDVKPIPEEFKEIKYRSIGPAAGGRVSRAVGVPGDPLTFYAAVSSGGVWKSSDGGMSFKPIFDDQPTQAIGSIAVAPSDPNVLYVGSGEANIRGNVQPGNGIYRSTDAGKTWKHVWKQRGQIGTVIVHPTNPDIAFAAVLGHAFGPNVERGVYRTTNGGKSWDRVLFKDKDTGASDVCFDPNNPRILFAGLWQTRRQPWELTSGGPGSGLYVSRDGGDTWTQLIRKDEGGRLNDQKEKGASANSLPGKRGGHLMEAYRDLQPIEDDLDAKIGERLKTIPGVQAIEFGLSDFVPLDNGKISHLARGWQSVPEEFRFLSGRKFDKDERGVALLGARLARSLDKKVGDQITVQDHLGEDASLKVIGIFESPTSANGFFQAAENSSVIMPLRELQRIKNRIGAVTQFWILVDNADAERVKSVKDAIEGLRDEKGNSLRLTARSLPASSSLLAPKECDGLPEGIWGRIAVGVARSNSQRIYALIEAEKGGLFRSDDGGDTWELVNSGRGLRQRAWYFTTLTIHPKNADIVYCPQVPLLKSIDGGKSFGRVKGPHHGDHHDLWIDPKNPERMIDSNDGGVDISTNGGLSWYAPPLPVCQFYHVAADNRVPYWVSGCMQDIGTASGPSNSLGSEGILLSNWHNVGGGETGFTAPDPADPNILYAGEYMGYVTRYDHRTRQARSIGIYPYNASGHAAADLKYRFQWTAPLMISPHDPKVVYHAANVLFRTSDAGLKWEVISPDMTRNDKSKQKWSGGPITGDNTGVEVYDTIFAIAESPKQKGLLWAGSDDGLVHVSDNGGKDWKRVTPPKMPEWGTVICIEPSPFQPLAAFVVVDCHKLDDNRPHLFHTTDAGKTWKDAVGDLPKDVYLRAVRHDPKQPGLLYLGTSAGVFFSANSGKNWRPLKLNLPAVQVCDLVVKDNDLVVGTDGRSLWILDDLTPIRTWSETIAGKQLHLFEPAPAYRYRYHSVLQEGLERGSADNPPQGAILHYFLKTKPKGDVVIEVFDQKDKLVRKLSSKEEPREPAEEGDYSEAKEPKPLPAEAGLQRVVWDLRYSGAATIKKAKTDGGNPKIGPLVLPGSYTIKLTVEGKTLTTKVEVKQDPRETVPDRVLAEQLSLILAMRDDISKVTKTVEQLRSVRKQITEQSKLLKDHEGSTALAAAGKKVLAKLDALEEKLHNPRAKISYDILAQKGGAQLYSQLAWLYEQLKDSDGPVGEGMNNVYAGQHALLETYQTQWRELLGGEVTRAAEQIRAMGGGIVLPAQKKSMDSASGEK